MMLSDELRSWIGQSRVLEEDVGLGMTRRIAGMLNLDPMAFRIGDELPSHWFAMYFTECARQDALGPGTWLQYLLANGLLRFRIPILFAISGYLLARRDGAEPHGARVRRRLRTLGLPYLLLSLLVVAASAGLGALLR